MKRILEPQKRIQLIRQHRKERDKRICDRIKAILLRDTGYSYTQIAEILLLDDATIKRHIESYLTEAKLSPSNGGSVSKLSKAEGQKLRAHLKANTYLYVKDICAYVKKTFGKRYAISGMTKWLQAQGFRYKKPHAVPAKADKERQAAFIEYYDQLKQETEGEEPIYFCDSVHPQHQTKLAYGWILKGERKSVPTTGRQKRLNFMGGICLETHRFVYEEAEKVTAESIKRFFRKLRRVHRNGEKLHIILDNAGYHKSKDIINFAKKLAIELHYLPPYSPNLNPIERLWKIMHEHVSYNKYYEKFSEFTEATLHFFRHIGKKKTLLRARITDNFQIIHSPILAS